jgi:hypothetical protein
MTGISRHAQISLRLSEGIITFGEVAHILL